MSSETNSIKVYKMITVASSIIIGLVLTVCQVENDECGIYVPATYKTKTIELGKELCKQDIKKYANLAMKDDNYYVLDAECVRLTD